MHNMTHYDRVTTLIASQGEGEMRGIDELDFDDVKAYGETREATHVSLQDDWTVTSTDKLPAATRQWRSHNADVLTDGMVNWATMSPAGFGPQAPTPFTSTEWHVNGDEVLIDVPSVDVDDLRREAGMLTSDGHGGRVSSASTYSDWMQAARITTPEDDDAFTSEGFLMWETLDDFDAEDAPINPYWA